ncbi:hypothetical protein FRX31_024800 [Thalictrum thalictroides]|uniref:Uncharacterized protein n=1 Tax=Thalictrum thalictroides TaxID=46969 RepID=A0A7J6VKI0_THATH|nr:hypothetical protein FRX31_024800 [Thalictrum thalictroides]
MENYPRVIIWVSTSIKNQGLSRMREVLIMPNTSTHKLTNQGCLLVPSRDPWQIKLERNKKDET